eukprot:scaffold165744_cov36-Cyclotella_meneghiniana.AAC.1
MTVLIVVEVQRILELRALHCCWLGWRGDESSSVGRGSAKCWFVVVESSLRNCGDSLCPLTRRNESAYLPNKA